MSVYVIDKMLVPIEAVALISDRVREPERADQVLRFLGQDFRRITRAQAFQSASADLQNVIGG